MPSGFEPGVSRFEIQRPNHQKQVTLSVIICPVSKVFQLTLRGREIPPVEEGMGNFIEVDKYWVEGI